MCDLADLQTFETQKLAVNILMKLKLMGTKSSVYTEWKHSYTPGLHPALGPQWFDLIL